MKIDPSRVIVILLWRRRVAIPSRPKRTRKVHFVGTSRKSLRGLPKGARAVFGFAILLAEHGMKHPDAKPLTGFGGAGVLEIVEDLDGDAYRAVYTVKFGSTVYVLHAFKKKSKVGSRTPPRDMELIVKRLKEAEEHYKLSHAPKRKPWKSGVET